MVLEQVLDEVDQAVARSLGASERVTRTRSTGSTPTARVDEDEVAGEDPGDAVATQVGHAHALVAPGLDPAVFF